MSVIRLSRENGPEKNFAEITKSALYDSSSSSFMRWKWQYCQNPFSPNHSYSAWVYILDNKPVGHIGIMPVELQLFSQKKTGGWAVDFITILEYRKRGIGRSLVEEAEKNFDLLLTVGQTDMSFNLFMKMGWLFLGYIPNYIKVWNIKSLAKGKVKNFFLAGFIFILLNFYLKIFNYFKRPRKREEIKVGVISSFNEEADVLWNDLSGFFKMAVPRSFSYLSWKYDLRPGMDYIKLRASGNGKVCGYLIMRIIKDEPNHKEGLIADLVVRPDDERAIEALLFEALKYLRKEGCQAIRCYINQKNIQKVLRKCGFFSRRPYMRFLINKKIDSVDGIDDLNNWFITAGDCDIDH